MSGEVSSRNVGGVPAAGSQAEDAPKFKCPADFVAWSHMSCGSTLKQSLEKNQSELWLIKAPAGFDPQRLHGVTMNLSGLNTVTVPADGDGDEQIFNILASSRGTPKQRLLTRKQQESNTMVLGPAFSGLINLCESYGGVGVGQELHVIPAAPPPAIPSGLKQRFQPFGSKKPPLSCEVDCAEPMAETPPVKQATAGMEQLEEEEGRRKKKKKKKDKKVKTEEMEVKTEPVVWDDITAELPQGDASEERKRGKKRKHHKQEEQQEPTVTIKQEVIVKEEPEDSWGCASPTKKKKKKKKKSRTDDD